MASRQLIADSETLLDIYRRAALLKANDERARKVILSGQIAMVYYSYRGQEIIPSVTGLNARLEIRVAQGRFHGDRQISQRGDGRLIFWLRSREGHAVDSGMLAIAADYVASGIAGATGLNAGGNSLDNTIRFGRIVPCEWILCDVHIETLTHGIVHGRMHLYSPDGVLMASAGQSMILRVHPAAG